MIWNHETRECKCFAISNFLFPYISSHLQRLLSLFSFPKPQQYNCLSCLTITCLFLPSAHVTLIYSATERSSSFGLGGLAAALLSSAKHLHNPQHKALSSSLHLTCQFYLPVWTETKRPGHKVSVQLFPYHKQIQANPTSLSLSPRSGRSPLYRTGTTAVLWSAISKTSLLLQNMLQHIYQCTVKYYK